MFVRRSATGSGATVVQVAEYQPCGTHQVLKHVRSAHSAVELGVLVARAYALIDELQFQPPLDVEAPVVVVPLASESVPAVADPDRPQPRLPDADDPVDTDGPAPVEPGPAGPR